MVVSAHCIYLLRYLICHLLVYRKDPILGTLIRIIMEVLLFFSDLDFSYFIILILAYLPQTKINFSPISSWAALLPTEVTQHE